MKTKGILTFVFCLVVSFVFGQHNYENQGVIFSNNVGSFGVGTNAPLDKLHVNGSILMPNGQFLNSLRADGNFHQVFGLDANDDLVLNRSAFFGRSSGILFALGAGKKFQLLDNAFAPLLIADQTTGNVSIGTATVSATNKLSVKGKIQSEEIQVVQTVADYVFYEDYNRMSLEDLEKYIEKNGYLPKIQNQKDVDANNGHVKLGELSISLMEKVEELTLHMIEMNKRLKQLENENKILKTTKE